MGGDINVHDQWAVESQGRIQDRTREHLGTTDKVDHGLPPHAAEGDRGHAAPARQPPMLLDAAQASAMTGPPSIDGIGRNVSDEAATEAYWQDADRARRLQVGLGLRTPGCLSTP